MQVTPKRFFDFCSGHVPLLHAIAVKPGDVSEATLAGLLLDTAALSARSRKPLVARLMPLPGLRAGDAVSFDFEYFAPSRVMAVRDEGVGGLLTSATFPLAIRPQRFAKNL